MKRCGAKGWCTVMGLVLGNNIFSGTQGIYTDPHPGHNVAVQFRIGTGEPFTFSFCPWCGASLLPKPIVVKTKYRGKR